MIHGIMNRLEFCYMNSSMAMQFAYKDVNRLKEHVGYCQECRKEIFCRDGFLDGVVQEDTSIRCFDCSMPKQDDPDSKD
ncbi:hypothetical protein D3P09_03495 [Paenibacillus pinisoli]|uniref:Uncharacterized protein n=1 Tax=Paenibacillus pinisoli TaxID=1276110 RepID=A0A3A6Q0M6_9BACL|nr:hypothetical protein D3P09_03495 [Paenibacillus pinisoli]